MHSLSSLFVLGAVALVAAASPMAPVNSTRPAVSSRPAVIPSIQSEPIKSAVSQSVAQTSERLPTDSIATTASSSPSILSGMVGNAPVSTAASSGLLGVVKSVNSQPGLGSSPSGLLDTIQTPTPSIDRPGSIVHSGPMKATVITVYIPVDEQQSTITGSAIPSGPQGKTFSDVLSDIPASAQAVPTSADGLISGITAFSTIPAQSSIIINAVSSVAAQLTKEMSFVVPLSTPAAISASPTVPPAAASSAQVPTATATPSSGMIGVNTLLKQVNSFVAASNGSTAADFPRAQANARNVADCASVQSEMEKLLNSGILKQGGTLNSTAGMGLPITKSADGQFMVSGSDIQLVSHQGSSLAFQIFRAADECDALGRNGNLTSSTNSTDKRGIGQVLCWLAHAF